MSILNHLRTFFSPSSDSLIQDKVDQIVKLIRDELSSFPVESENTFFEIEVRLSPLAYRLLGSILDLDSKIAKKLIDLTKPTSFLADSFSIAIHLDKNIKGEFKIDVFQGFRNDSTATIQLSPEKKQYGTAILLTTSKKFYGLYEDLTNIGRDPENDICIEDPYISRNHGQIRKINDHYHYFDLKSSGGSLINNEIVSQKNLTQGDVLKLGKTILIFMQDGPTEIGTDTTPTKIADS